MKKRSFVFVALLVFALPAICSAGPPRPGPYASIFLGASFPTNTSVTSTEFGAGGSTFNDRVEFDPGINIGATGGFDFGFLRLEGELSHKNGEMSTVTEQATNGNRFVNVDGRLGALALLFNIFFDLHNSTPVTPYFGGGVGFATLHLSDTIGTQTDTGDRVILYRSDDDTVFAYQAGAGLEIDLNYGISLDLAYRYFGTSKARFDRNSFTATDLRLESHNASVGLRIKF